MRERVVVVGADAAGMSAAHQALRTAKAAGRELDVVVLEKSSHTSYSACGIPYWIAGDVDSAAALVARTAEQHRAMGVDLRMDTSAVGLDLDARTVTAFRPDGGEEAIGFDQLVLATGALPRVPAWARTPDGAPVPGVAPLKTLDDGARWVAAVTATRRPGRAVVVGGGYIGIETAEAFVRRGLETTLVTRREVMSTLDPDMGARVRMGMTDGGVEVVCSEEVDGLDVHPDGSVARGPLRRRHVPRRRRRARPRRPARDPAGRPCRAARRGVRRPAARRPPAGHGRRLGGRRLLRVPRTAGRRPGVRAAGDARQQAGPGGGGEPRGRRRTVRRRRRHGHHAVLRRRVARRGGPHRADHGAGEGRRSRRRLAGHGLDDDQRLHARCRADRRQGARAPARTARRGPDRRRAGLRQARRHGRRRALVRRRPSPTWQGWTWPTRRRSRRCGTPCRSPAAASPTACSSLARTTASGSGGTRR